MASNDPPKIKSEPSVSGWTGNIPRGLIGKDGTVKPKSERMTSTSSAKQKRDLSLGGAQRRTFKPNIPVRSKDKTTSSGPVEDKLVVKERRIKKEKVDRPAAGRGRGRGQSVIQSQSIFESGPTEKTIKRESIYGGGGGGGGGGSSSSSTSVGVQNVRQTKAETQAILDQLLQDDFMDDDEDMDITNQPVALPLLNPKKYEEVMKGDIKESKDVKFSPTDPSLTANVIDHPDDSLKLVLMQLPDCLPGLLSTDERPVKVKSEPSTSSSHTQAEKTIDEDLSDKLSARCKLSDLSEGRIGKIQIMKSGRTRLVLGDVTFDLSRGAPCGFLQELVYIDASDADQGNMACLGAVKDKLVVVPNIENLLRT